MLAFWLILKDIVDMLMPLGYSLGIWHAMGKGDTVGALILLGIVCLMFDIIRVKNNVERVEQHARQKP